MLAGTAWPGKEIGQANAAIIAQTALIHETGLHAWDHHAWQARSGNWNDKQLIDDISRGITALETLIGQPVTCSAVAGWRADDRVVHAKETFHLRYNSDCRGTSLFQMSRGTPVYTIHAEVEGIAFQQNFDELLTRAADMGITFCPLGDLLPDDVSSLPTGQIVRGKIPGREGWIGRQQPVSVTR